MMVNNIAPYDVLQVFTGEEWLNFFMICDIDDVIRVYERIKFISSTKYRVVDCNAKVKPLTEWKSLLFRDSPADTSDLEEVYGYFGNDRPQQIVKSSEFQSNMFLKGEVKWVW